MAVTGATSRCPGRSSGLAGLRGLHVDIACARALPIGQGEDFESKIRLSKDLHTLRGTPVTLVAWRKPEPIGSRTTAPGKVAPRGNPRLPAARWPWLRPQRMRRAPQVSSFPYGPRSWAGAVQLG